MKKTIIFAVAMLMGALWGDSAPVRFSMQPESPRRISVGSSPCYTLVEKGRCKFDVVVPPKSNADVHMAARELCSLLSQQTGARITPVSKASKGFSIELGTAEEPLDRDGFIIRTKPGKVQILGSKTGEGTLFGVYDFLERFAGVRFYFPGRLGTILPPLKNWRIPEIDITDRPDHQHRKMIWRDVTTWPADPELDAWYSGKDRKQDLAMQQKRIRCSTNHLPNCHGLVHLGLVHRFAQSHPEYFALHKDGYRMNGSKIGNYAQNKHGQFCLSSPGLKEEIFQDIAACMNGESAKSRNVVNLDGKAEWAWTQRPPFFCVMPNDGMYLCRCPKCWKVYSTGNPKLISEKIWQWKVDLANRMIKEKIPGYLTSMAYTPYKDIPESVEFPKNLIVMLAVHGPWSELVPAVRAEETAILKAWRKKMGAKIYMWNYPTKYTVQQAKIANPSPRAVASFYSRAYPESFGALYEGENDCWLFAYLSYYMYGKVMWDHQCNAEAILDEHHRLMFRKSASEMKQFFDTLESHWVKDLAGNREETALGPSVVLPSEYKLWTEIYSKKERDRLLALITKAEKKEKGIFAERIRYIRRFFLDPMLKLAAEYERRSSGKDKWKAHLPEIAEPDGFKIDADEKKPVWQRLHGVNLVSLNSDETDVPTVVKMFQTPSSYYFLFECAEPAVDTMVLVKRPRDHKMIWSDNAVEIYLDTEEKRESYCQWMINASGDVADLMCIPAKHHSDWSFDGKAEVKTRIDKAGKRWFAEVRIPRSSLSPEGKDTVIANFARHRVTGKKDKAKLYHWSCFGVSFNDIANFGQLTAEDPDKGNLLTNGDFRTDPGKMRNSWFNWGKRLQGDTRIYRTAGRSIKLDGGNNIHLAHRLNKLKPDTWYVLRYFAKLENIVNPMDRKQHEGFSCRVDDGGFTVKNSVSYLPSPGYTGTMKFQHLEFRFKTASDAGQKHPGIIYFCRPNQNGTVWVDHVSLQELDEK